MAKHERDISRRWIKQLYEREEEVVVSAPLPSNDSDFGMESSELSDGAAARTTTVRPCVFGACRERESLVGYIDFFRELCFGHHGRV